jgi:hypothetical protein
LIVLDLTDKNDAAVEASYLVAQRIVKVKEPHTIAEELILPCAKYFVSVMMGSDYLIKLQLLSLSNEPITRKIKDMTRYFIKSSRWNQKFSKWHVQHTIRRVNRCHASSSASSLR